MNLLEIWIEDIVKIEKVQINGVDKLKIYFNTVCWGSKEVKCKIFDSMEHWEKFKEQKYYLG
ncbi:hypothetical protein JJB71_13565 [Clostridium perfringens]|uniref:hypothetical protein n=1 Tax=Clostridium perfringens TaxID=1502 RepID=UPI001ABB0B8C|nr:hypothetical protein [Clostridium perfringens]MBO3398567.1 hypothetical protein [Clostridium perfringens]